MEEQVVAIFAGINGYLDDVPSAQVPRFQDELREHLRSQETLYADILAKKDLPDELADSLRKEIDAFKKGFVVQETAAA
jgi:F-type H+-transporting ATPase subunit alpha